MPGLPRGRAVNAAGRVLLARCRAMLHRDLLEQSVAERIAWAVIASAMLWLAIYWVLS